jgi:hypothetical protein
MGVNPLVELEFFQYHCEKSASGNALVDHSIPTHNWVEQNRSDLFACAIHGG